jgi:hypothetical protein
MANFNLNDYETVEERIKRFYSDNADGRIITENLTTPADRERNTWVVRAIVFMNGEDQELKLPKATGLAFEIDGGKMANATSALENCETSAIGRALANANYSGNKRASREEMQKVERGSSPIRNWDAEIAALKDEASAMQLWNEARTRKAPVEIQDKIKAKGKSFGRAPV